MNKRVYSIWPLSAAHVDKDVEILADGVERRVGFGLRFLEDLGALEFREEVLDELVH